MTWLLIYLPEVKITCATAPKGIEVTYSRILIRSRTLHVEDISKRNEELMENRGSGQSFETSPEITIFIAFVDQQ